MNQTEPVPATPTSSNTHQVENKETVSPNRKRNRRRRLPSW
ncbi:MAG: hypothetical protein ACXVCP_08795 [Bdellovibrio sp.]